MRSGRNTLPLGAVILSAHVWVIYASLLHSGVQMVSRVSLPLRRASPLYLSRVTIQRRHVWQKSEGSSRFISGFALVMDTGVVMSPEPRWTRGGCRLRSA